MKTELKLHERDVLDFSVLNTHMRCPRMMFYNYVLNRSPQGENFPIGFGVAYHKYREELEKLWLVERPLPVPPDKQSGLVPDRKVPQRERG